MPPKIRPRGKAAAQAAAAAPAAALNLTIQLQGGEQDLQNVAYITTLTEAWALVSDHPNFENIQQASPLSLTEGGAQVPYRLHDYLLALSVGGNGGQPPLDLTPKARFTCAINLAWLDFQWSATPGVPVRMAAVMRLRDTAFKSPCPAPVVHVAVPRDPTYQPHMHKGALKQVSPEEITAAYLLAIARDVLRQEGDDIMEEWAKYLRSSTCIFIVLDSDMEMYWHAVEQREALEQTYKLARRSCYQRLHEIVRLMERMRQKMKETDVTAKRVADEYKANVASMTESSGSAVTLNFVDTAKSVASRMLSVPEIAFCMADLDEHHAVAGEFNNPFDSHSRLQAIMDKCKAGQTGKLIWCVEGIWYHAKKGNLRNLSFADLKGSPATGNRGYIDLLMYKKEMRALLFRKASDAFGPESHAWLEGPVQYVTSSFRIWSDGEQRERTWQAGRRPYEIKWVNLLVEVLFGTDYDAPLKLAVKTSKSPDQALDMPGLSEQWTEITETLTECKPANVIDGDANDTADVMMTTSGDPMADGVFEFLVRKKAICH